MEQKWTFHKIPIKGKILKIKQFLNTEASSHIPHLLVSDKEVCIYMCGLGGRATSGCDYSAAYVLGFLCSEMTVEQRPRICKNDSDRAPISQFKLKERKTEVWGYKNETFLNSIHRNTLYQNKNAEQQS